MATSRKITRPASHRGLPLPREHGSWVMMAVSFLAGAVTAARNPLGLAIFLAATVSLFVVRRPAALLLRGADADDPEASRRLRKWIIIVGAGGSLAGLILLTVFQRWLLLPLGLAALALVGIDIHRAGRTPRPTLASELAGAAGLALVAPGAYYVATGQGGAVAVGLGLACALHFISGVLHIRMKARWVKRPPVSLSERWAAGWESILYQIYLIPAAVLLGQVGLMAPWAWIALVPAAARGLYEAFRGRRETNFKRLGWRETGYSLAFLALLLVTYSR